MSIGERVPTVVPLGEDILERMVLAVEKVRDRLLRSTAALEAAKIPYAVIGGNAVAAWVSKVDPGAARNTVDVDIMVNRIELPAVKVALEGAGFHYYELMDVHRFLDGPEGRPRDALHLHFAGEKVKQECSEVAPTLAVTDQHETYRILALEPLVAIKLKLFRLLDRVHLRDMIEVGLLDASWLSRLPVELAVRLQKLLDNPDG